jgi:hypothetical protein
MSLGRRIERRPRTRLRVRPSRASRGGAPRCLPPLAALGREHRHPTAGRPLGTRTLRRHRPPPAGRSWPPSPRRPEVLPFVRNFVRPLGLQQDLRHVGGGVVQFAGAAGGHRAPVPAGSGRASRAGVSMAPTERLLRGRRTARGPGADRPVRSRAQEHAGSGAGAPGPASGHPRDRQARGLHAVEESSLCCEWRFQCPVAASRQGRRRSRAKPTRRVGARRGAEPRRRG